MLMDWSIIDKRFLIYFLIKKLISCNFYAGVTTKEERSTEPNPNLGTAVSSHMDSSSSGVIQQFNYGNGGALASKIDAITKQFQEWQQKFQHEMTAFNTNLNNQILQSFQYSS